MPFQNKDFWMGKGAGCFTDSEMAFDNSSRPQAKRPHQWFLDPTEPGLFPSKKPAVETSNNRPISGVSNRTISGVPNVNLSWEAPSSFHSVTSQVNDRLFGSELPRAINFDGRNFQSVNAGHLDIGRRGLEDQFGNDASVGLSMSHTMEDPGVCFSYGGIRKVKVNQVKDTDSGMSIHMGNQFNRADQHTISFGGFHEHPETNHLSNRNHAKDSENGMSTRMDNHFNRGNNNTLSFNGFQEQQPGINSSSAVRHSDNGISMPSFHRGDSNTISFNTYQGEPGTNPLSGRTNQVKDSNNVMSLMGSTFSKVDSSTISFAELDHPSGSRLISSYDSLLRQSSIQPSETSKEKVLVESNAEIVVSAIPLAVSAGETPKSKPEPKVSKKLPPNSFPSNVRSLLSTGILDGIHVKYISWSREELAGMIKGSGYLCGCQTCQYSKVLNAYEFERHAGCKTKHPNNHIYFENGKTIYAIVQELRSTPQNMLFEAIKSVTGSTVNEKNFRVWKASFEAATRELQRIYGKDEIKQTSPKDS